MTAEKKPLTQERLKELLHYDPETGVFTWRVARGRGVTAGSPAGSLTASGYMATKLENRAYLLHRLAFLYQTGSWPVGLVDHADGRRSNNIWRNLRDVDKICNSQNRKVPRKDSGCSLLGVSLTKNGRFTANIGLGTYDTPGEAHAAYIAAKTLLHPGFVPTTDDELQAA